MKGQMMVKTPKLLDQTYERAMPEGMETPRSNEDNKVKIPRPPTCEEPKPPVNDPGIKYLKTEAKTEETTHTVKKPVFEEKREDEKQRKTIALAAEPLASESKTLALAAKPPASESKTIAFAPKPPASKSKIIWLAAKPPADCERIKKRGDVINCHCRYRGRKSLMVQCQLCLCWQHATCHNMQRKDDVPLDYRCSICLNPPRGRRSMRFLHDQEPMYEGRLPGGKPCELLRRSHMLTGQVLKVRAEVRDLKLQEHLVMRRNKLREPDIRARQQDAERCRKWLAYMRNREAGLTARLDVIETEIEELEAIPSDDNEPPLQDRRMNETIKMLMRDLEIMEELGRIT